MKKYLPGPHITVILLYCILAILWLNYQDRFPGDIQVFGQPLRLGEVAFFVLSLATVAVFTWSELHQQTMEARYRALAEATSDAVLLVKGMRIIDCNPQTLHLFGASKAQILGQPFPLFSRSQPNDSRPPGEIALKYVQAAYAGEDQSFNWRHERFQGQSFDAHVSVRKLILRGKPHLMVIIKDLSQQQEHQRILRKNAEQRRTLLEVSQNVIGSLSVDEVISRILSTLRGIVEYESCALFYEDSQTQRVYIYKGAFPPEMEEAMRRWSMPSGTGIVGAAFQQREAILVNDAQLDPRSFYPDGRPPIDHIIAIPLIVETRVLGVFNVNRRTPTPFSEDEFELVRIFSNYAAQALRNAALYQETHHQVELMTRLSELSASLNQSSTLEGVAEAIGNGLIRLVDTERVAVFHVGPEKQIRCKWSRGISVQFQNWTCHHVYEMLNSNLPDVMGEFFMTSLQELTEEMPFRMVLEREAAETICITQLKYENRLVAVVALMFDERHPAIEGEREIVQAFGRHAAIALENMRLYEELEHSYLETVLTLARAVDARDTYTGDHSARLSQWSEAIARKLGCSDPQIQSIQWATLLHDIGKIGIPDAILNKPGPLSDTEWTVMKRHPEIGANIIAPVKKLVDVAPIVHAHQEKFDGSGYPLGLRGEEIPLGARILKVADAYGAMIDQRIYRPARSPDEALEEIRRCTGTDFDPQVVKVFLEVLAEESRPGAAPLASPGDSASQPAGAGRA